MTAVNDVSPAFEPEEVKTSAEVDQQTVPVHEGLVNGCAYYLQPQKGFAGDDTSAKFLTAQQSGKASCHLSANTGHPLQQWILGGSVDKYTLRVFDGVIVDKGDNRAARQTLAFDGKQNDDLSDTRNTWKIKLQTVLVEVENQQKYVPVIDPETQLPIYSVQATSNGKFLTSDPYSKKGSVCVETEMVDYAEIQKWIFVPINLEIISVEFHIDEGTQDSKPLAIAQQELTNNTSVDQQMKWTTTSSVTNESHFEHEVGASIAASVKFSAGIPFVEKGEITTTASANYSYTWGKSTTKSQQWSEEFPVLVPKQAKVTAQAIIQHVTMEVPYTMTVKSGLTGVVTTSSGVWKGVDTYDIQYTLTETKL